MIAPSLSLPARRKSARATLQRKSVEVQDELKAEPIHRKCVKFATDFLTLECLLQEPHHVSDLPAGLLKGTPFHRSTITLLDEPMPIRSDLGRHRPSTQQIVPCMLATHTPE